MTTPRPAGGAAAGDVIDDDRTPALRMAYSGDEQLLRDTCRQVVDREMPTSRIRELMGRPLPPDYWATVSELGWPGVAIPEEHGGHGYTLSELAILAVEHGRGVQPGPLLSSALAGIAVDAGGTPQQRSDLLPRLASGDLVGTCSLDVDGSLGTITCTDEPGLPAAGRGAPPGIVVSGVRRLVPETDAAEMIVLDVRYHGTTRLAAVPLRHPAVRVRDMVTIDLVRRYSEVRFDDLVVDASCLLPDDTAAQPRTIAAATVLQCAESLGAAERLLEMTVQHALTRQQFGRAIGSFQAVKHRLADMRIRTQASRVAVRYAGWAVAHHRPDATEAAHVAKQYSGESLSWLAGEALQLHGGVGFTWANDLHLYLRRLKANELLLGSSDWHARRLGDWLTAS